MIRSKQLAIFLLAIILVGAGAFYGGSQYQQRKLQNARREFLGAGAGRGQFGQRAGTSGLKAVNGTIISQDEESISVELPDGSSKIVLLSESSVINKTEEGSREDLSEGTRVVVTGQENSDGSITAQNIQLNPRFAESLAPQDNQREFYW